jgi:hypothetical protein
MWNLTGSCLRPRGNGVRAYRHDRHHGFLRGENGRVKTMTGVPRRGRSRRNFGGSMCALIFALLSFGGRDSQHVPAIGDRALSTHSVSRAFVDRHHNLRAAVFEQHSSRHLRTKLHAKLGKRL